MITPEAAAQAQAARIADVLTDPHRSAATIRGGRPWPQSLAGGAAGIALLHIERARSGHADHLTAHDWLTTAVEAPLSAADNAGLFYGAPALAFVIWAADGGTGRYRDALARLDTAVSTVTQTRLATAYARIERGERPTLAEFDLIRGLAGLAAYHLARHPDHPITGDVLTYLVRLTEPLTADDPFPPWWTPVWTDGEPNPNYREGHGNFGVSHGVGSVLALLALSLLQNASVPGAEEAIGRICAWTDHWRQTGEAGPWWPGYITADQVRMRCVSPELRPRPSWCYGIAGTARAQQLAAMALGDTDRQQTAEEAILAALRDPAHLQQLGDDTGLCHGKAGLLHAAWRMSADARTSQISAELPYLAGQLAADLSPRVSDAELLDGAAGAALALHTFGTGTAPASRWDTVLAFA
ncbi:lanthionine synthetase C family protein [Nonomuraea sp. NPDC049480]|uniref:lanthionine synthetase C family protein n=1 Tax=Nonomuraea sp. NPDC049480 TaxID=3364353 RepID=UPI00379295C7